MHPRRFLKEFTINTLKPADCYEYLVRCMDVTPFEQLPKRLITLQQEHIKMFPLRTASLTTNAELFSRRDLDETAGHSKPSASHNATVFKSSSIEDNTISISKVAFCVTVPERPDIVLLILKHQGHLVCRAFVFSSLRSANDIQHSVALRFERSFRDWQSSFCRRSFTKKSIKVRKKQVSKTGRAAKAHQQEQQQPQELIVPQQQQHRQLPHHHRKLRVQSSSPF